MILHGDALERLRELDTDSAHGMVTDPPSGTGFMGKQWDKNKGGRDAWVDWLGAIFAEARRVLVPGAHVLVWALPRTSHWTALALEAGGFEIRDSLHHVFGSGFPKSQDTAIAIDKQAGEIEHRGRAHHAYAIGDDFQGRDMAAPKAVAAHVPITDDAKRWQGYGTALKPAHEVWWLARAPLGESSIARNVLEHGAGAVNVDGCRVEGAGDKPTRWTKPRVFGYAGGVADVGPGIADRVESTAGRWPPNFLLSHDCDDACRDGCPVGELDEQSGASASSKSMRGTMGRSPFSMIDGSGRAPNTNTMRGHADTGGASRFFPVFKYAAKPSRAERSAGLEALPLRPAQKLNSGGLEARRQELAEAAMANQQGLEASGRTLIRDDGSEALVARFIPSYSANNLPTVKPVELMRWLVRLVTPHDGVVLDPFTGSGSTACACALEGFGFVGIEQDAHYIDIARRRVAHFERLAVMPSADVTMRGDKDQMSLFG